MGRSRVLIVSASAGAGHVSAAAALEKAFRIRRPEIETRHVDILDFTTRAFKKIYARSYLLMVNHVPGLWGYFYAQLDRRQLDRKKRKIVSVFDRINFRAFRELVESFVPDAILATHFLPLEIRDPARGDGALNVPLALVITDFDVHAYWVHRSAALYFVGSEEVKYRLASRGIDPGAVVVSGIPIDPVFSQEPDRDAIRGRLGLRSGVFTILVMSGGAGTKSLPATIQEIYRLAPPLQILAVCGRNEEALAQVSEVRAPDGIDVRAFGFVDNVHELLAVSDVAVTKSGGLSISECLARHVPMIVWSPIPGQEERNCDALLEASAAQKAVDHASLRYKLDVLRGRPDVLRRLREGAARMARPDAAFVVVESTVDRLLAR